MKCQRIWRRTWAGLDFLHTAGGALSLMVWALQEAQAL